MGIQFHHDRVALHPCGNSTRRQEIPQDGSHRYLFDFTDTFSLFHRDLPGERLDSNIDTSVSFASTSWELPIDIQRRYRSNRRRSRSRYRYACSGGSDVGKELRASTAVWRARSASRAALCLVRKPPCFAVLRIEEGAGGPLASCCSFSCSKRTCRGLETRVSWRASSCCAPGGASWIHVQPVVLGWKQAAIEREATRCTSGEVACTRTYV